MIYILQFERILGNRMNSRGQARYYVGYCRDGRLAQRLEEHRAGGGAAITRAAVARGIEFKLVATLTGGRATEHRIKRYKNTPAFVQASICG